MNFETLQVMIFTFRAMFFTGIMGGSVKVGGIVAASVLTFNQDILEKKENGLMFCYHCDHQIDPKAKANLFKALDSDQGLISFSCETCRKDNYFPISPAQRLRAIHGGKLYGELRRVLNSTKENSKEFSQKAKLLNKANDSKVPILHWD